MVGKNLSHYKILEELGRGGMGIVYKAEDTKLDRTVAIKVLPSAALSSEDDRARFYREAKAAAQLHHPHIASVFEIDEAVPEGSRDDDLRPFIAMEFISGETLHDRIQQGPLKLEEAVRIASQIASGLKVAHAKDIVHRDIKGGNIILTADGDAKILDFGLAQTAASTKLTQLGSTLGTVAYMSPEQARGEEVDGRTDLWSLGVILFEMVTGRSPFPGDYEQALIYSILNQDPEPITGLRTGVSMEFEMLVSKCLEKEAKHRYQSAADLIADLDRIGSRASKGPASVRVTKEDSGEAPGNKSASRRAFAVPISILVVAAIGLVLISISLMFVFAPNTGPESSGSLAATIELIDDADNPLQFAGLFHRHLAVSPDGSRIVFSALKDGMPQLFVRDSGSFSATSIPGTEGALAPAFSEDGGWLAYCDDRSLNKVQLDGGLPIVLEENAGRFNACRGVSWIGNEAIIYSPSAASGLTHIFADGSGSRPLTNPDQSSGEVSHRWPHVLPDKRGVIFTAKRDDILDFGDATVSHYDFSTETVKTLFEGGTDALVLADGTLLYGRDFTLRSATFDFGTNTVVGGSHKTLLDNLKVDASSGAANYAVSTNGILAFVSGNVPPLPELTLRDNESIKFRFDRPDYGLYVPTLSPDNTKAVLTMAAANDFLVIVTMGRTEYQILPNTANIIYPSWGPDSSSITYISDKSGTGSIYVRDINDDSIEMLYENAALFEVGNWDPDGTNLVFVLNDSEKKRGIWRLTEGDEWAASRIIDTVADEYRPTISPDGTLIAYLFLDDSGIAELFVQDYPALTDQRRVAEVSSSTRPRWDGENRVYFDTVDDEIVRLKVSGVTNLQLSGREIFLSAAADNGFDVLSDGTEVLSFAMPEEIDTQKISLIRVITGWKANGTSFPARN